ncbi:MAG: Ig domain-containing protein, partial [Paludibacteraceae bacterium]|nr:Ig domain-containing protein [Paludibacteraceae bacterium]
KYKLVVKKNVISITMEDAEVELGSTVAMHAVVTPEDATDKSLTWTSSDESIATVDDAGVVTGLAEGEVTITATSVDDPEVSASAKVVVFEASAKTIAEVIEGKLAKFTLGEVTVVYAATNYLYIQDATGIIPIYKGGGNYQEKYANGNIIKGIEGAYGEYNGNAQIVPSNVPDKEAEDGEAVEPALITEAPVAADMNKYVKVENAAITAKGTRLYIFGEDIQLFDNFKLGLLPENFEGKTYDIEGFVTIYKETIEISVTALVEHVNDGLDNVEAELDLNAPMFNVLGVRVDATYKGVVIQNGKKFMLR